MPQNLLPEFDSPGLDHYELLNLMGSHFRFGCSTDDNSIIYPCENSYIVKVRSKDERIVSIEPGPGFSAQQFAALKEKARSTLIDSPGQIIRADILFSSKPVKGDFRAAGGQLQILPAPDHAPHPPAAIADHPFILEFPIRGSSDGFVTNNRAMRRALEWTWILNVLLRSSISRIGPRVHHLWGLVLSDQLEAPRQENVKWVQEYYAIDNLPIQYAEFSSPGMERMRELPHDEYYNIRFIASDDLVLPDSLSQMIDMTDRLPYAERGRFLRAVRWFSASGPLHLQLISSCFVALVSAIESLIPEPEQQIICPECQKDRSPGPTQRFQDFVETYAPTADSQERNRKWLYKIRSDLSHGRDLLRFDSSPWDWSLSTSSMTEREALDELFSIARKIIVNWLRRR